jgi:GNAT superfamily N-acetyltransferase
VDALPPSAAWRAMETADLPAVERAGDAIHPAYPEEPGVFAERLGLYPAGCFVLVDEGTIEGYAVSHPWLFGEPPKLNSRLGRLPDRADTFYIHDIALLPRMRGRRCGVAIVAVLARLAMKAGFGTMSLVAVSGSEAFWQRNGFDSVEDPAIQAALSSYGEAARFMAASLGRHSLPDGDL